MDINQIKDKLVSKRSELFDKNRNISKDYRHIEGLSRHREDQALEVENDEVLRNLDKVVQKEITDIDSALFRISEGTYGICKNCGEQIAKLRLEALPYAIKCIECA